MAKSAAEIRREKLRNRQKQSVQTRDQKGLGRKSILDWSRFTGKKPLAYQAKSGKDLNVIDFLPWVITQEWYKNLRTFSGLTTNLSVDEWDYKLEIPVHPNVGENNDVLICNRLAFGGKCPNCDDMFTEYENAEPDEKTIKALKPSWRCWYNIYDYSEESNPDGVNGIWEDVSYYLFEKEILAEADEGEEVVLYSDIEEGKTVEIKGKEKELGKNKFVEAGNVEFKDREAYTDDIVNETISFDSLVKLCTYEEFLEIRKGTDVDPKTGEAATGEQTTSTGTTRRRSGSQVSKSQKESVKDNECPSNLKFGNPDLDSEECKNCPDDVFKACADASDKKDSSQVEENKEEDKEPDQPAASGRRRRQRK